MRYEPEQLDRLIASVERQAAATERQAQATEQLVRVMSAALKKSGLGGATETLYTRPPEASDMVDEKTMAAALAIPRRTLAYHRDRGKLPGCWVKNGRRILWHVEATKEAWKKGIS